MTHSGYERQRFVSTISDIFDCVICCEVVMDPYECHGCGKLFCQICIGDWSKKNPTTKCPNRCNSQITAIFSKALIKMYNNFQIKCLNPKCHKVVKLIELKDHEQICQKIKCWNFDNCGKVGDEKLKYGSCSSICSYLHQLNTQFGNKKKMYDVLGQFMNAINKSHEVKTENVDKTNENRNQIWDDKKCGLGVLLTDNGCSIFLKQQSYVFRTVIGTIGFTSGINYWQIIADSRTENELKIGVTSDRNFDLNSAFCDHPFGYAYYGLGQLRHGSNASGSPYGKRFKKQGVLGCCLNMNTGTLSFALNGEYFGVAYTDNKLKQGTYYPAVSLLHCAGCKIRSGIPVPSYFKD